MIAAYVNWHGYNYKNYFYYACKYRQPWKFIEYEGKQKAYAVEIKQSEEEDEQKEAISAPISDFSFYNFYISYGHPMWNGKYSGAVWRGKVICSDRGQGCEEDGRKPFVRDKTFCQGTILL